MGRRKGFSTVALSKETIALLKSLGRKGETFEIIVRRILKEAGKIRVMWKMLIIMQLSSENEVCDCYDLRRREDCKMSAKTGEDIRAYLNYCPRIIDDKHHRLPRVKYPALGGESEGGKRW